MCKESRARLDVGQTLSAGVTPVDTAWTQYGLEASSWRGKSSDLGGCDLAHLPLRALGKKRWKGGCEQMCGEMRVDWVSGVLSGQP